MHYAIANRCRMPASPARRTPRSLGALFVIAVAVLGTTAFSTTAEAWRTDADGGYSVVNGPSSPDLAMSVAIDSNRDVIAGGFFPSTGPVVLKLAGSTGGELWRRRVKDELSGNASSPTFVAIDGANDIVAAAAGWVSNAPSYIVAKKRGSDGDPLWTYSATAPAFSPEFRTSGLVVDAAGDVFAAGYINANFVVVKLRGTDGVELWRAIFANAYGGDGFANALALAGGDVVAVGAGKNAIDGRFTFLALKLRGSDGGQLWRYNPALSGEFGGSGALRSVAVDGSGDVLAAGFHALSGGDYLFSVVKLRGSDGTELWGGPHEIDGTVIGYPPGYGVGQDLAQAIALDAGGNAVAVGNLNTGVYPAIVTLNFFVVKLAAADGTEIWRKPLTPGIAFAVGVDAAGDVVATGQSPLGGPFGGSTWALYKVSGTDGSEIWHHDILGTETTGTENAPPGNEGTGIALDADRNVVVIGTTDNDRATLWSDFTVVKLNPAGGTSCSCGCGDGVLCSACGEQCDDGNQADGDGCSLTCQDQAAPVSVSSDPGPGGTVTTDGIGDGATAAQPVQTAVTSPTGGTISITQGGATTPSTGYQFLGQEVLITAQSAMAGTPLILVFKVDASRVPADIDLATVAVLKDGSSLVPCTGAPGVASPDPCIAARELLTGTEAGDLQITVLTSTASTWNVGIAATPTPTVTPTPSPTPTPQRPLSKCNATKKKCIGKYVAAVMGCHAKAATKNVVVDQGCLSKARAKISGDGKGCFDKADAKNDGCGVNADATSRLAIADLFVVDTVDDIDPGYPAPTLSRCQATEKKCVGKLAAGLMACNAKANGTGIFDAACAAQADAKFSNADAKGCFDKALAKGPDCGPGNDAVLRSKTDDWAEESSAAIDGP